MESKLPNVSRGGQRETSLKFPIIVVCITDKLVQVTLFSWQFNVTIKNTYYKWTPEVCMSTELW